MPRKDGSLTRGEQDFIEAYAQSQDRAAAEKSAGLRPNSGYAVLARPEIQAEIARRISAEIHDLGHLATAKLRYLVTSDKVPAAAAFQAAKYILDRIEGGAPGGPDRDPAEMTPEELAAEIARLETRAAAAARPVDAQVIEGPTDPFG